MNGFRIVMGRLRAVLSDRGRDFGSLFRTRPAPAGITEDVALASLIAMVLSMV